MEDETDTTDIDESAEVDSPDISAYEAKISELTGIIEERDLSIADLGTQLTAAKAANYDLLMSIPKGDSEPDSDVDNDDVNKSVDIDDLFD